MPPADERSTISRLVGIPLERRTYTNLIYILLAIPLGFLYHLFLAFGFAIGIVLSVALIGIAVLLGMLIATRGIVGVERWLANALLRLDIEPADDIDAEPDDSFFVTIRRYLDAASTWRGVGFVILKLFVAITAIMLLVFLSIVVSLLAAPFRYPHEIELVILNDEPVVWLVETLPEAGAAALFGLVLGLVFLHLTNGVAYVCARMAEALLGTSEHTAEGLEQPEEIHRRSEDGREQSRSEESETGFVFGTDAKKP